MENFFFKAARYTVSADKNRFVAGPIANSTAARRKSAVGPAAAPGDRGGGSGISSAGFDLDLTYITERIVAMAFPADGVESTFRNNIDRVADLLKHHHGAKFLIYNLTSERLYDYAKFDNQVITWCGFPDHNPPPLDLLFRIVISMHAWLSADPENVAVIHCLAGKGRTGTVIACFFLFSGLFARPLDALNFFGVRRSHNNWGVTGPSQLRYVDYFARVFTGRQLPSEDKLILANVTFHGVPAFNVAPGKQGCCPFFEIYSVPQLDLLFSSEESHDRELNVYLASQKTISITCKADLPATDLLVTFKHVTPLYGTEPMFHFGFNLGMVTGNPLQLRIERAGLDRGYKDPRLPIDFAVILTFREYLPTSSLSQNTAPSPLSLSLPVSSSSSTNTAFSSSSSSSSSSNSTHYSSTLSLSNYASPPPNSTSPPPLESSSSYPSTTTNVIRNHSNSNSNSISNSPVTLHSSSLSSPSSSSSSSSSFEPTSTSSTSLPFTLLSPAPAPPSSRPTPSEPIALDLARRAPIGALGSGELDNFAHSDSPNTMRRYLTLKPNLAVPGSICFHAPNLNRKLALARDIAIPTRGKISEKGGFLIKQGHVRKAWKRRWFALHCSYLSYFKSPRDSNAAGTIQLDAIESIAVTEFNIKGKIVEGMLIRIVAPQKDYCITADDRETLHEWLAAIQHARTLTVHATPMIGGELRCKVAKIRNIQALDQANSYHIVFASRTQSFTLLLQQILTSTPSGQPIALRFPVPHPELDYLSVTLWKSSGDDPSLPSIIVGSQCIPIDCIPSKVTALLHLQWVKLNPHLGLELTASPDLLLDLRFQEVKRRTIISSKIIPGETSVTRRQKMIKWNFPHHHFDLDV